MNYFTLEDLKDAAYPLQFHGETLFEIHKKENGETKLLLLDEEQERYIDSYGDVTYGEYRKTSKIATLHLDTHGIIVRIEHPYQVISKNNQKKIHFLLSLLGNKIIF